MFNRKQVFLNGEIIFLTATEWSLLTILAKNPSRPFTKKELYENLPVKLKQAAIARERHPEASLTELAAMMEPPITKPAMNHRLKKLVQIAQEANK